MKPLHTLVLALLAAPAFGQGLQQKVFGSDTSAGDSFGTSVAIQGDRAVVGAQTQGTSFTLRPGAAYVFERGPSGWVETAVLVSPGPLDNERFGSDVAVDGDRILVGAYGSRLGGEAWSGAAYLFEKDALGWHHAFTFVPSDTQKSQLFGHDVALDGDRVAIGAEYDANPVGGGAGAVYVFDRVGGTWLETQKLTSLTAGPNARFGTSLDLEGERLLIGAPLAVTLGGTYGSAFVFELQAGSWSEVAVLVVNPAVSPGGFGDALALDGDSVVVGAYSEDGVGWNSGAAYAFERDLGGWSLTQRLEAPVPEVGAHFGYRIALEGDVLAISAHRADLVGALNTGRVLRFERDASGWHALDSIHALPPVPELSFGASLALDAGTILVGTPDEDSLGVSLGEGNGAAFFTRFATLASAPDTLALSTGGALLHTLDLTADHAGEFYLLFASATGIAPGFGLGSLEVPLAVDALTFAMIGQLASPQAPGYFGLLDAAGRASAQLLVPGGLSPALAGTWVFHAGLTLDAAGNARATTNPTRTQLAL